MKAYTYSAFRMAAVATIKASADTIRKSADTIRKSADRLIVFLSAISLFAITSYGSSSPIFPREKFSVESMLQREAEEPFMCLRGYWKVGLIIAEKWKRRTPTQFGEEPIF